MIINTRSSKIDMPIRPCPLNAHQTIKLNFRITSATPSTSSRQCRSLRRRCAFPIRLPVRTSIRTPIGARIRTHVHVGFLPHLTSRPKFPHPIQFPHHPRRNDFPREWRVGDLERDDVPDTVALLRRGGIICGPFGEGPISEGGLGVHVYELC
jgi:hypothetical protein